MAPDSAVPRKKSLWSQRGTFLSAGLTYKICFFNYVSPLTYFRHDGVKT